MTGKDNPINPRYAGGEPEGYPGDVIMVTARVGDQPVVMYGGVQTDGYFTDEFYDEYLKTVGIPSSD